MQVDARVKLGQGYDREQAKWARLMNQNTTRHGVQIRDIKDSATTYPLRQVRHPTSLCTLRAKRWSVLH